MKTVLVSLILVLSGTSSFAQSTAIEGSWGTRQQSNGIVFDITFAISKNSVTVTNTCSVAGNTATAQVTAQSTYTDNSLTVWEFKQDQKSINGVDCNVSIQADTMGYSIQGNQLIFTHAGSSDQFSLNRK